MLREKRHRFIAALRYLRDDFDDGGMSNNRYALQPTYGYDGEKFAGVAKANFTRSEHHKKNPIYDKTQKGNSVGQGFTGSYKKPSDARIGGLWALFLVTNRTPTLVFMKVRHSGTAIAAFYRI